MNPEERDDYVKLSELTFDLNLSSWMSVLPAIFHAKKLINKVERLAVRTSGKVNDISKIVSLNGLRLLEFVNEIHLKRKGLPSLARNMEMFHPEKAVFYSDIAGVNS